MFPNLMPMKHFRINPIIVGFSMVRPKKKGPLAVKRSVSIDPKLFEWVKSKIEIKRFSSLSHAVNEALLKLKKEIESEE